MCSSGWSKPVWYFSATSSTRYSGLAKVSGSSFSFNPLIHLDFGVGLLGHLVVFHRAGKGHQALDGIALLADVAVKFLLVAHRLQPRTGDHHRLGAAADLVAGMLLEMLDHYLGFLADIVRMQAHEASQRPGRLLALDVGVVLGLLDQLVIGLIGDVVLQHVLDKAFLDGLTHGVAVEGLAAPAENGQGLMLGRGGEGEKAHVRLAAALGHGPKQALQLHFAFFLRPLPGPLRSSSAPPSTPFSSVAVSPDWELCASSMITAYLRVGR